MSWESFYREGYKPAKIVPATPAPSIEELQAEMATPGFWAAVAANAQNQMSIMSPEFRELMTKPTLIEVAKGQVEVCRLFQITDQSLIEGFAVTYKGVEVLTFTQAAEEAA